MKEEMENLSAADERVRQMLRDDLNRVEAPKDFEFRLKARIANANPKSYRANYKRRFAFALPASALAIVSAFALVNGNFFGDGSNQISSTASTAQIPPTMVAQEKQPSSSETTSPVAVVTNKSETDKNLAVSNSDNRTAEKNSSMVEPSFAVIKAAVKTKNQPPKSPAKENEILTKPDQALTPAQVRTPRNLNPDKKVPIPKDFEEGKGLSVQESFSTLGIETVNENGVLKVKSVKKNSIAERLGMKADDTIETVNGEKISVSPPRGKKIEVKKLGVRRGTEQLEINLQGNPK